MAKKKRARLTKGDIIEIPLPNKKKAFAQYLCKEFWGDLIGVYDYEIDIDQKVDIGALKSTKYKFPFISTRIKQGMKLSEMASYLDEFKEKKIALQPSLVKLLSNESIDPNWKIAGNIPVEIFDFPNFIWKEGGWEKRNSTTKWYVYDGKENIEIGKRLPDKYKNLGYHTSYSPGAVIERIITGKNPDKELIQKG